MLKITEFFDLKDIKKSLAIHVSVIVSIGLSAISSYLDDKHAIDIQKNSQEYQNKIIKVTIQSPKKIAQSLINTSHDIQESNTINNHESQGSNQINVNANTITQKNKNIKNDNTNKAQKDQKSDTQSQDTNTVTQDPILIDTKQDERDKDTGIKDLISHIQNITSKEIPSNQASTDYRKFVEYQLELCWTRYTIGKKPSQLMITVKVEYDENGYLKSITNQDNDPKKRSEGIYAKMEEDIVKALNDCNPLRNLDKNEYDSWKTVIFNFKYKN